MESYKISTLEDIRRENMAIAAANVRANEEEKRRKEAARVTHLAQLAVQAENLTKGAQHDQGGGYLVANHQIAIAPTHDVVQ